MRNLKLLFCTLCCLLMWLPFTSATSADTVKKNPASSAQCPSIYPSAADLPLPDGVDKQTGFRMQRYRAPVPTTNPGTEVIDTDRAFELYQTQQVQFIDVYPPKGLGPNPMDGTWMTNESHRSIEGAVWLPEVGRGHIEQDHIDYFQRNLAKATDNDRQTPLVFFCTADCWQSWNAARRALHWGYTNVLWYPAGTDGWLENNHALVPVEAENFLGN